MENQRNRAGGNQQPQGKEAEKQGEGRTTQAFQVSLAFIEQCTQFGEQLMLVAGKLWATRLLGPGQQAIAKGTAGGVFKGRQSILFLGQTGFEILEVRCRGADAGLLVLLELQGLK